MVTAVSKTRKSQTPERGEFKGGEEDGGQGPESPVTEIRVKGGTEGTGLGGEELPAPGCSPELSSPHRNNPLIHVLRQAAWVLSGDPACRGHLSPRPPACLRRDLLESNRQAGWATQPPARESYTTLHKSSEYKHLSQRLTVYIFAGGKGEAKKACR